MNRPIELTIARDPLSVTRAERPTISMPDIHVLCRFSQFPSKPVCYFHNAPDTKTAPKMANGRAGRLLLIQRAVRMNACQHSFCCSLLDRILEIPCASIFFSNASPDSNGKTNRITFDGIADRLVRGQYANPRAVMSDISALIATALLVEKDMRLEAAKYLKGVVGKLFRTLRPGVIGVNSIWEIEETAAKLAAQFSIAPVCVATETVRRPASEVAAVLGKYSVQVMLKWLLAISDPNLTGHVLGFLMNEQPECVSIGDTFQIHFEPMTEATRGKLREFIINLLSMTAAGQLPVAL
jgi:hypothetical protein